MKARFLLTAGALATSFAFSAQAQQPMPPQLTYVQPLPRPAITAVQEQLQHAGDYNGRADGVWGPDSVVALQRFQQTHGLQVSGQLNQATVATLGLDPDRLLGVPQSTASANLPPATLAPRSVHAVQLRLDQLGFYRGPLDGVWGPGTQTAIARFQQSRGLQPNSQLNPATVAALGLTSEALAAR